MNVGLAITRNAQRSPHAPAIFGEAPLTQRELEHRSNQIGRVLTDNYGLQRGERVALLVANRPEVVEILGATAKVGLVYVGLNFRLGPVELEQVFENAQPSLVLTDTEHLEQVTEVADGGAVPVVNIDDATWLEDVASRSTGTLQSLHDIQPEDDFCIVYTSGTTGRPKGVVFDHARVLYHALVAALEYSISSESRYLIQIPHNSSVNITILPSLIMGGALGFCDSRSFDPVIFARMVETEAVTHSFLVPTQLMRLLDRLPTENDGQLASLVTLGYGASPISPDRLGELVARFGPIFNQLYGMAEIASIGTILRKQDHVAGLHGRPELLASCGQPSYGVDVRVVDEDGNDVAVDERGEVVFAGPHVMKHYYRDPERTSEVLIDGWMHSGDIAQVNEDGFIFIVDRIKNLIIRGGLNIAPTEIENVLYRHPAVLEVAVVGIPDTEWGEAILAVVACRDGASVEAEELRLHCRTSELTSIKVPERIEIVDSLPKNAVGKIAKNEIREQFWGSGRQV